VELNHIVRFHRGSFNIMRTQFISVAIAALAILPASAEEGWINLFNGTNLDGWTQKTGNATYFAEEGCIVGQMHVPGGGTNSFLCTTNDYDNFVLELDFKADPRLNSGVQIRSQYADQPVSVDWKGKDIHIREGYVYGYQVEVDTDLKGKTWTGGIYDEQRQRGYIDPAGGLTNQPGLAFTKLNREITKPDGWNHLRIEAVGDSMRTYLNGVPRADIHDSLTVKGFFGLQVHNSNDPSADGAQVRFKNIRLQPLTLDPPVTENQIPPNTLTGQEKTEGWKLLWDGQTTDGWRSPKGDSFPNKSWVIKDGELSVVSSGNAEAQAGGDIITRDRYANFELVADFKITPGCNSGIKIFVQPNISPIDKVTGKPTAVGSAIGLEYQILDDAKHPDAKLGYDGDRRLGALYDLLPCDPSKPVNPVGEWNTARIVSRGNHVEHWLNGKKILEYDRGSPAFRAAVSQSKFKDIPDFGEWSDGHILLQEHGSAVSFRNIKLRELPAN
jgi:Domain of Unknown Function (DUF1080)